MPSFKCKLVSLIIHYGVALESASNAAGLLSEMCAGKEGERRCLALGQIERHRPRGPGVLLAAALVAAPAAIATCRCFTNVTSGDFSAPELIANELPFAYSICRAIWMLVAPAAMSDSAPHVEEVADMILATSGKVIEAMIIFRECLEAPGQEKILTISLVGMKTVVDDLVALFTAVYKRKKQ